MDRTTYYMIGRGFAGWHASGLDGGNRTSLSGYDMGDEPPAHILKEAAEGALVYCAAHLEDDPTAGDAVRSFVIGGPMVDVTLPAGTISAFGHHQTLARMAPDLEGAFAGLARLALDGVGSLDSVSTDVYAALLREKVPGVRIGHVRLRPRRVEWES